MAHSVHLLLMFTSLVHNDDINKDNKKTKKNSTYQDK